MVGRICKKQAPAGWAYEIGETLGDMGRKNLLLRIRCLECWRTVAKFPRDIIGFPNRSVDDVAESLFCKGCGCKSIVVCQVSWCCEIDHV